MIPSLFVMSAIVLVLVIAWYVATVLKFPRKIMHTRLRVGESAWCRTESGSIYEITFHRVQDGLRHYVLTKYAYTDDGKPQFKHVYEDVVFRHSDLKVGEKFMCDLMHDLVHDQELLRSAPLVQVSFRPLQAA